MRGVAGTISMPWSKRLSLDSYWMGWWSSVRELLSIRDRRQRICSRTIRQGRWGSLRFVKVIVVVVSSPVISIVVSRLKVGPFLGLLPAYVDLVGIVVGDLIARGSAETGSISFCLAPSEVRTESYRIVRIRLKPRGLLQRGVPGREDIPICSVHRIRSEGFSSKQAATALFCRKDTGTRRRTRWRVGKKWSKCPLEVSVRQNTLFLGNVTTSTALK